MLISLSSNPSSMLLTRIHDLLTLLNILNRVIESLLTIRPHLIAIVISALIPDDSHQLRVDLLELLQRQPTAALDQAVVEVLQLVLVQNDLVRA